MTDSSPLSSADPNSLSLLFATAPTDLSPADERRLIAELRRRRDIFAAEEAAKAASGKRRAKAAPTPAGLIADADKPVAEIDLEDMV